MDNAYISLTECINFDNFDNCDIEVNNELIAKAGMLIDKYHTFLDDSCNHFIQDGK